MGRILTVLMIFLSFAIPARVFAKADISRITIKGADLKTPIEITDPKTLANFDVWSGPGTSWTGGSPKEADRFIIDWSQGVTEPPKGLQRYEVLFYAKMPNERLVYVVFYEYDPATEHGYIYLPGRADERYRLNVGTIYRGVEGRWFRAWSEWDSLARALLGNHTAVWCPPERILSQHTDCHAAVYRAISSVGSSKRLPTTASSDFL
jgi:hypothetical protein